MFYYLYQIFKDLDIPGMGLLGYLSFRSVMAVLTALLVELLAGGKFIKFLQKKQIGEEIRDLGLEGQMQKKGTPTMGGIGIIFSLMVGVLLWCDLSNIYTILLIVTVIILGGLGFIDDYIKVFRHDKGGVSENGKLLSQFVLALIIGLTVCYSPQIKIREHVADKNRTTYTIDENGEMQNVSVTVNEDVVKSTKTTLPFIKDHELDYSVFTPLKGKWGWWSKWAIYLLVIVLIIVLCTNSVNLTDGLDGLAAGTTAISGFALLIFAYLSGNVITSGYLNIMFIPGAGEVAVFLAAVIGALVGFLWFNSYPAQVFMGDTGSLALGGIIGVSAILIRKELLLPLLCGIFFVEGLSALLQRYYFKYTRKRYGTGRRIFKMTPLHHHFQKEDRDAIITCPRKAIPESKIVVRFWIVQIILSALTIALLKVR